MKALVRSVQLATRSTRLVSILFAVLAVLLVFGEAEAIADPPVAKTFKRGANEQIRVVPGTTVGLHWKAPAADEYFLVTSNIPDFGNAAKTTWPSGSGSTWSNTWGWWVTTSTDMRVSIPSTATAGQAFKIQLVTCSTTSGQCSNVGNTTAPCGVALPNGKYPCAQATLTATGTNWSTSSFGSAYSTSNSLSENIGNPLDVTTDSSGASWNSSEFSNTLSKSTHGGSFATQYTFPQYVQPGNTITLNWGTSGSYHWNPLQGSGTYYLVASPSPTALPNFGAGAGTNITWPSGSSATWNSTWAWYKTTSESMTVKVPSTATNGTTYGFQVFSCNATQCSNGSGTSATGPYGGVLNITIAAAPSTIATSRNNKPFTYCFSGVAPCSAPSYANCSSGTCEGTSFSALAERVTTDSQGRIWTTRGGWEFDPEYSTGPPILPQPNDSQIVSFDPAQQTFCTYQVPGVDPEVIGVSAQGDRIFFLETSVGGHPSYVWGQPYVADPGESRLAYFKPSEVGGGCAGNKTQYFPAGTGGLVRCPVVRPNTSPVAPSNCNMMELGPWGATLPFHVMADPATFAGTGGTLWTTSGFGSVDRFVIDDLSTGKFTFSSLKMPNHPGAGVGVGYPAPWQLSQDGSYVYATNYGDNYIDRLDKSSMALTQEQVPVQSDSEQLHSTVVAGGKVYFTLSDDSSLAFGGASSFGTIANGSSWGSSTAPTSAKIYSGLDILARSGFPASVLSPTAPKNASFIGIDVRGNGTVTLTNQFGIVSVAP